MNTGNAFYFLIDTLFNFYAMLILARLILQLVRADFYNPISQFIVKVTNPLLAPLRRLIPPIGQVDSASILLIVATITIKYILIGFILRGDMLAPAELIPYALIGSLGLLFNFFFFTILIEVILSWVSDPYNPAFQLVNQINSPVMGPIRKALPSMGGLDLSPMVALLLLGFITRLLGV